MIDSPGANTPETKARRKIVAEKINKVLDKQRELENNVPDIRNSEYIVHFASEDQILKARSLVQPINAELEFIVNPVSGLN